METASVTLAHTSAKCAYCSGGGKDGNYQPCRVCKGFGSVLVVAPAEKCAYCSGGGKDGNYQPCRVCKGCGHANPIAIDGKEGGIPVVGSSPVVAASPSSSSATSPAVQIVESGTTAYFVGVFISMGMNFAWGNGLGALLICWLSWVNVGYGIVKLLMPELPAQQ